MIPGNIIVKNAAEVIRCSGNRARSGQEMSDLSIISNGSVVIEDGVIKAIGKADEVLAGVDKKLYEIINAEGKAVLPGFVDSHTHFVFGGYRAEEFSWRLRGDSYMEILQRGGGILNTVKATREASKKELLESAKKRLDSMLMLGVTTVEGKSGYGLDYETEIKQLEVMAEVNKEHPIDVVGTFLGAHAIPPEYQGKENEFIEYLIDTVLPVVAGRKLAEFCDVFCEKNVFSVDHSRKLLRKAQELELSAKLHADEIVRLGGAELAAELRAVSADHLLHASDQGIQRLAQTGVVATLLPGTAFSLKEEYARARDMIDQGCAVALATDMNPGSCFTESIPLIFALAVLYMKMSIEEAVTAFTLNGAAALGRAHSIGSLDVGKLGDLIILEFPSYTYIPYHIGMSTVEKVVKRGVLVFDKEEWEAPFTYCQQMLSTIHETAGSRSENFQKNP